MTLRITTLERTPEAATRVRSLLLVALIFTSWSFAHRGGPPALLDAPLGDYRVTYFDDMHVGSPEAVLLLSGQNLADVALTLRLTSPRGETRELEAKRVRETPGNHVFLVRSEVAEAGDWRVRVTLEDPEGVAVREVVVSTKGRFAGFWRDAAPYLGITFSLVGAFVLVWRFAVPSTPSQTRLETL